jgi:hypothetical protein
MADHYIALDDGEEGFQLLTDFTIGVANTVGVHQVELRVQDGTNLSKKDLHLILKAFMRFFEDAQRAKASGFQLSG